MCNVETSIIETENRIVESNVKKDQQFFNDYSGLIVDSFELLKNKTVERYVYNRQNKFHENLTWFQKNVPFVDVAEGNYIKKTRFRANMLNLGLELGIQVINIIFESGLYGKMINAYIHMPKMFESLISCYLYVTSSNELPVNVYLRVKGLASQYSISKPEKKIDKWISKSISKNYKNINLPNKYYLNTDIVAIFLKMLYKMCDAEDLLDDKSIVNEKLKSLSKNYFGLTESEVNFLLNSSVNENMLLSSIIEFTNFNISTYIDDLVGNIIDTNSIVDNLIEFDPLKIKRNANKEKIIKAGSLVAASSLTFLSGGIGDFIITATTPLLLDTFGNKNDQISNIIKQNYRNTINNLRKKK